MDECIFCRIVNGVLPAKKVYEDARILAFEDAAPQAPVHVLIIPKVHIANLLEADTLPDDTLAGLLRAAAGIAGRLGLENGGFRVVSNCGAGAGQTVDHLHLHLLGGAKLSGRMV